MNKVQTPEHLKFLAGMYSSFVSEQIGRLFKFLGKNDVEKKLQQLKRLNDIINELKVPPQVYLRVQFDKMIDYARGKGMSYVPIGMLISKNAVLRFKEYQGQLDEIYPKTSEKKEALLNTYDPVRKLICDSAETFAVWLGGISGPLDEFRVLAELEIVARLGLVASVYLLTSPLLVNMENAPKYLADQIRNVNLTDRQREAIEDARRQIVEKYKGKNYGAYL